MRKLAVAIALLWPVAASAEPIYLDCVVPFQRKDGGTSERRFEVSVDAVEKTGNAREINPPYQLGGGRPTSPIFEPDSVTFVVSSFEGIIEAVVVSRTDLSIVFYMGSGAASLQPASLKGQCRRTDPQKRIF